MADRRWEDLELISYAQAVHIVGDALFGQAWLPISVQDRAIFLVGPSHPDYAKAVLRDQMQEGRIAAIERWLLVAGAVDRDRNATRRVIVRVLREKLRDELHAPDSQASGPKPAPDARIHAAISDVYDQAEIAGRKPPNINQLASPALLLLQAQGLHTSKRRIQLLARDKRHAKRRRLPGKTVSSETGKSP